MEKLFKLVLVSCVFLGTFALASLPSIPQSHAAWTEAGTPGVLFGKTCERCKRGKDGKMVCTPVPCS